MQTDLCPENRKQLSEHLHFTYHFGNKNYLRLEAYADASYGGEDNVQAKSHHGYLIKQCKSIK